MQKSQRLSRTQTKCVDCGCQIDNIDRPERQYCYCRKIYTCNGSVYDNKEDEEKQGSLFDTLPDRTYED